jgi:S-(hydroxymethyl)glutathione dehydrogenase/alcohol dehydrogenase
VDFSVCAGVKP